MRCWCFFFACVPFRSNRNQFPLAKLPHSKMSIRVNICKDVVCFVVRSDSMELFDISRLETFNSFKCESMSFTQHRNIGIKDKKRKKKKEKWHPFIDIDLCVEHTRPCRLDKFVSFSMAQHERIEDPLTHYAPTNPATIFWKLPTAFAQMRQCVVLSAAKPFIQIVRKCCHRFALIHSESGGRCFRIRRARNCCRKAFKMLKQMYETHLRKWMKAKKRVGNRFECCMITFSHTQCSMLLAQCLKRSFRLSQYDNKTSSNMKRRGPLGTANF